MTKKIVYENWMKAPEKSVAAARLILDHFDVTELKRRKRAPGRARVQVLRSRRSPGRSGRTSSVAS